MDIHHHWTKDIFFLCIFWIVVVADAGRLICYVQPVINGTVGTHREVQCPSGVSLTYSFEGRKFSDPEDWLDDSHETPAKVLEWRFNLTLNLSSVGHVGNEDGTGVGEISHANVHTCRRQVPRKIRECKLFDAENDPEFVPASAQIVKLIPGYNSSYLVRDSPMVTLSYNSSLSLEPGSWLAFTHVWYYRTSNTGSYEKFHIQKNGDIFYVKNNLHAFIVIIVYVLMGIFAVIIIAAFGFFCRTRTFDKSTYSDEDAGIRDLGGEFGRLVDGVSAMSMSQQPLVPAMSQQPKHGHSHTHTEEQDLEQDLDPDISPTPDLSDEEPRPSCSESEGSYLPSYQQLLMRMSLFITITDEETATTEEDSTLTATSENDSESKNGTAEENTAHITNKQAHDTVSDEAKKKEKGFYVAIATIHFWCALEGRHFALIHSLNQHTLTVWFITRSRMYKLFLTVVAVTHMLLAISEPVAEYELDGNLDTTLQMLIIESLLMVVYVVDVLMLFRIKSRKEIFKSVNDVMYIAAIVIAMIDIIRLHCIAYICNPMDMPKCDIFKITRIRYPRLVRPIFLLHNLLYMRRDIEKLMISLLNVLDVLIILFATTITFGVFGYMNFSHVLTKAPHELSFHSFGDTIISLYQLMTTEGYYLVKKAYSSRDTKYTSILYFGLWTFVSLFILATFLGSVHNTYCKHRKRQVRERLENEKKHLKAAFDCLTYGEMDEVNLEMWMAMMKIVGARFTETYMDIYNLVDTDQDGTINLEEFTEACDKLRWLKHENVILKPIRRAVKALYHFSSACSFKHAHARDIDTQKYEWVRDKLRWLLWHPVAESSRLIILLYNITVLNKFVNGREGDTYSYNESLRSSYSEDTVILFIFFIDTVLQVLVFGFDEFFSRWHKTGYFWFTMLSGPLPICLFGLVLSDNKESSVWATEINLRLFRSCNILLIFAAWSESMKYRFERKDYHISGTLLACLGNGISGKKRISLFFRQIAYMLDFDTCLSAIIRLAGVIFRMMLILFTVMYPFAILSMALFPDVYVDCPGGYRNLWYQCEPNVEYWNSKDFVSAMLQMYHAFYTGDVSTLLIATQRISWWTATLYWISFSFVMSLVIMNTIISNILEHYDIATAEEDREPGRQEGEFVDVSDLDLYLEKKTDARIGSRLSSIPQI